MLNCRGSIQCVWQITNKTQKKKKKKGEKLYFEGNPAFKDEKVICA